MDRKSKAASIRIEFIDPYGEKIYGGDFRLASRVNKTLARVIDPESRIDDIYELCCSSSSGEDSVAYDYKDGDDSMTWQDLCKRVELNHDKWESGNGATDCLKVVVEVDDEEEQPNASDIEFIDNEGEDVDPESEDLDFADGSDGSESDGSDGSFGSDSEYSDGESKEEEISADDTWGISPANIIKSGEKRKRHQVAFRDTIEEEGDKEEEEYSYDSEDSY